MARMDVQTNTLSAPAWAGDWMNREHVLPGGAKVDPAAITANGAGFKFIASGTVLGRTFAERETNTAFGLAADADDEVFILAYDVPDAAKNNDIDLYRPGGVVKENFLPDYGTLTTAIKAKLRALYQITKGVA